MIKRLYCKRCGKMLPLDSSRNKKYCESCRLWIYSHREEYRKEQMEEEILKKKDSNYRSIVEINKRARANGYHYGSYVAKEGL